MSFLISTAGIMFDCGDLSQLNHLLFVCADRFYLHIYMDINTEQV